jgi:hypothetical protein
LLVVEQVSRPVVIFSVHRRHHRANRPPHRRLCAHPQNGHHHDGRRNRTHQPVFVITFGEGGASDGDGHGGRPNNDGAEDDNLDGDSADGCNRTTMAKITTRIGTRMMRTKTTTMLEPMPITMVIATVIGGSPGRRRRE